MAARVRAFDWSRTPLGPRDRWPQSLSTLVDMLLAHPLPMIVLWGPDLIQVYNDGYAKLAGTKHPAALGQPTRECWPEVWHLNAPVYERVLAKGESVLLEDQLFPITRTGLLEDAYFTLTYSPVRGEGGQVAGVILTVIETTAKVRAERERERRQSAALAVANLGTFEWDVRTNAVTLDDRSREMFGFAPGDGTRAEEVFARIDPADLPRVHAEAQASQRDLSRLETEYRLLLPDGSVRTIVSINDAIPGPDGRAERMIGVFADVTQRRRADEARRVSEFRFQRLVEHSPQSTQLFHPDGRTRQVNRAFERLFGITLEQLRDYNILRDPELVRLGVMPLMERAFAGEAVTIDPIPYVPDRGQYAGQTRWAGAYLYPVKDEGGRVEEIVLVHNDITEQRMAEGALRESEGRFRQLADAMPQMMWVTRPDGYHEYYNRRWYEFTGVPEGSTDGEGWNGMFHPEDQDRAWAAWRHSLATGEPYEIEYRLRHRSGEYRWTLGRALPVRDGRGDIERWFGTCTDIDAMKRLTAEREHLLKSEQAARTEAEAANRAKDKFLAVLSHELRTPLSPVVMTIPSMEIDPELPIRFREDLAMVRRNIDLEVKLIDDLLDLSRVTSGKLRLNMRPVRVHELLRHVVQSSGGEAAGKRLRVRHELLADNDEVSADAARLQQVFWNLVRNSIKFTPDGGDISVRTWNAGDGLLLVEVSDSGVGIPPESLPRVFDAFEQGKVRTTRQFGGLGLGLAIAKAVVEMHGGSIRAASDGAGKGATFTVGLTTSHSGAEKEPKPVAAPAVAGKHPQSRILLVEDHPDTSRAMASLLSRSGYEVKAAHSVASALQLAAAEAFDIMVSDIGLPDATGYELMAQITERHGIRGIALSGYGMEEDVRKSREAGFVEHVVKPVNVAELQEVIERVLSM